MSGLWVRIAAATVGVLAALVAPSCNLVPSLEARPAASSEPIRGLWITRWDYRTRDDVARAIDRAADLGMTDVFWQVRGQADAFYHSRFEPWGEELVDASGGHPPAFDPLELATRQARVRGVRLHAWINVMPLWRGETPPRSRSHPFHLHDDWRLRDASGTPQPLNSHYVIVDPTRADVQNHIVSVARDIVTRYPVDGLHLDYVRFVSESMDPSKLYPTNPERIQAFERETGVAFDGSEDAVRAHRDWKRSRITDLVRRLRREAISARQGVWLSAAVWRRPDLARDQYLQDAATWAREGTLDLTIPMIYTDDDAQFDADLAAWRNAVGAGKLAVGIGTYKHADGAQTLRQAQAHASGGRGYVLFAYASLFESADPNQDKSPERVAERARRLRVVQAGFASP